MRKLAIILGRVFGNVLFFFTAGIVMVGILMVMIAFHTSVVVLVLRYMGVAI